jgi:sulfoxide reductase heme-binding subunit YedZ
VTHGGWITRVVKPGLWVAAAGPLVYVVLSFVAARVDGDEVKFIQHVTGTTALVSLFITLMVTPLRRLSGINEIVRVRRLIGLTAFWYALLHLLTYLVFDQALSPGDIADDIAEHPWVLVGFAAFLMLLALAVTSTQGWVRRLGGKRWQRLHLLVYPAAVAGVLHYLWLVKKDVRDPVYFAVALAVILATRVLVSRRAGSPARRRSAGAASPATFVGQGEDIA